jgi:penicillin-insensitive murein endopeptidase
LNQSKQTNTPHNRARTPLARPVVIFFAGVVACVCALSVLADDDDPSATTTAPLQTPDAAPISASAPKTLIELLRSPEPLSGKEIVSASRKRRAGLSLGNTSVGRIHDAAQINRDGKHVAILPTHWDRDRGFGSASLVRLLQDAGAEVAKKHKGARLMLGDLSAKEGGKVSGHRSHQAGRDVDIVFFYQDAKGKPIPSESMLRVKADGSTANKNVQFDPARNWTLVRAMIEHPEVEVQYIFGSRGVRALLLAEAARRGESADLIAKAEEMIRQPSDSAPHDDHFHVRVFCDRDERAEGCVNRGKLWPWANLHDDAAHARAHALLTDLPVMSEAEQRRAIAALVSLELQAATPWLADTLVSLRGPDALQDALAALRTLNADILAVPGLSRALWATHSQADRQLLALALGDIRVEPALDALIQLANHGLSAHDDALALAAIAGMRRSASPRAIPYWIDLLVASSPSAAVRVAALDALQNTARRLGPAIDLTVASASDLTAVAADWRAWWDAHGSEDPTLWLALGLHEHLGLPIPIPADAQGLYGARRTLIPALIAAHAQKTTPPLLADNAHTLLVGLTDHKKISASLPPDQRHKQWLSWWKKNQKTIR